VNLYKKLTFRLFCGNIVAEGQLLFFGMEKSKEQKLHWFVKVDPNSLPKLDKDAIESIKRCYWGLFTVKVKDNSEIFYKLATGFFPLYLGKDGETLHIGEMEEVGNKQFVALDDYDPRKVIF